MNKYRAYAEAGDNHPWLTTALYAFCISADHNLVGERGVTAGSFCFPTEPPGTTDLLGGSACPDLQ